MMYDLPFNQGVVDKEKKSTAPLLQHMTTAKKEPILLTFLDALRQLETTLADVKRKSVTVFIA